MDLISFFFSKEPKTRINFSESCSLVTKNTCFSFRAIQALLQSHAEFNTLLRRNPLLCYSCIIVYSFMIIGIDNNLFTMSSQFIFQRSEFPVEGSQGAGGKASKINISPHLTVSPLIKFYGLQPVIFRFF